MISFGFKILFLDLLSLKFFFGGRFCSGAAYTGLWWTSCFLCRRGVWLSVWPICHCNGRLFYKVPHFPDYWCLYIFFISTLIFISYIFRVWIDGRESRLNTTTTIASIDLNSDNIQGKCYFTMYPCLRCFNVLITYILRSCYYICKVTVLHKPFSNENSGSLWSLYIPYDMQSRKY